MAETSPTAERIPSAEERIEILDKLRNGMSVRDVTELFHVSANSVKLIKESEKIERMRSVFLKIDKTMSLWILDRANRTIVPTSNEIRMKAVSVFEELKMIQCLRENFFACDEWLANFLKRNDLEELVKKKEEFFNYTKEGQLASKKLKELLAKEQYKPHQIFCCDETSLCWKKMPENTLLSEANMKDRLNILLSSNLSGDYRCKPLVVHAGDKKIARGKNADSLSVYSRANSPNAWMTPAIFTDWFEHCFVPEIVKYVRTKELPFKILLLCDSSINHPTSIAEIYPNIKVVFISPKAASTLLPLQRGAFLTFKYYYHKGLLAHLDSCKRNSPHKTLRQHWADYSLDNCFRIISSAWNEVSPFILMNGWKKLFPIVEDNPEVRSALKKEIEEIVNMSKVVGGNTLVEVSTHINSHDAELDVAELLERCESERIPVADDSGSSDAVGGDIPEDIEEVANIGPSDLADKSSTSSLSEIIELKGDAVINLIGEESKMNSNLKRTKPSILRKAPGKGVAKTKIVKTNNVDGLKLTGGQLIEETSNNKLVSNTNSPENLQITKGNDLDALKPTEENANNSSNGADPSDTISLKKLPITSENNSNSEKKPVPNEFVVIYDLPNSVLNLNEVAKVGTETQFKNVTADNAPAVSEPQRLVPVIKEPSNGRSLLKKRHLDECNSNKSQQSSAIEGGSKRKRSLPAILGKRSFVGKRTKTVPEKEPAPVPEKVVTVTTIKTEPVDRGPPGVFEPSDDNNFDWELEIDSFRVKEESLDEIEVETVPSSSRNLPATTESLNDVSEALEICRNENCGHCKRKNLLYSLMNFHACLYYDDQKCTFCGDLAWFLTEDSLIIDSVVHLNKRLLFCAFCDQKFDTLCDLQWHKCSRINSHSITLVCIHCSEKHKSVFELTKHMFTHCGFSKFTCSICLLSFTERHNLRKHELEAHKAEAGQLVDPDDCEQLLQQPALTVVDEVDNAEPDPKAICDKEVCNHCFDNQSALGLLAFHYCEHPDAPDSCYICLLIQRHLRHEKRNPGGIIHLKPCQIRCSFCHEYFADVEELKAHACEVDPNGKEVLCRQCGVYRPSGKKLMSHYFHHYHIRAYSCKTCGQRFVSDAKFTLHEQSHYVEKRFKCKQCGESFLRHREYTRHMYLHNGGKPYQCNICHKTFSARYMLSDHQAMHLEKKPYVCSHCDRSYTKKRTLDMHIYNSHEGPQLICDICGKRLMNWATMRSHIAVHDSDKLHRCEICRRAYTTAASLRRHILTHTSEKNQECKTCGMSFYHSYQLKLHELTHLKEKPFPCSRCDKSFSQRRQLVAHEPKCPIRINLKSLEIKMEVSEIGAEVDVVNT